MSFPEWQTGQASPEVPVNEAFDILKFLAVFGRDPETTSGLTWGYLGGPWGSLTITDGTISLTGSSTNYIVTNRTTGVVTASTSTTNWNNVSTYARLYTATTNSVTVTSYVDYRGGTNGALGPRAVVVSGLPTGTEGDLLRYNDVSDQWEAAEVFSCLTLVVGDETTDLTTGTAKYTFRMPYDLVLSGVKSSVAVAPTGSTLIVDIKRNGTTILSTLLSIDATEKTSKTAATPAVISNASLSEDDEITIDITQVGSTVAGAGLKVYLIGKQ